MIYVKDAVISTMAIGLKINRVFLNLFIRHIHYYSENVQLKTDIIRMARSYMANFIARLKLTFMRRRRY